jgi:hypothetical protein
MIIKAKNAWTRSLIISSSSTAMAATAMEMRAQDGRSASTRVSAGTAAGSIYIAGTPLVAGNTFKGCDWCHITTFAIPYRIFGSCPESP